MMKTAVIFVGLLCVVWGYPKTEDDTYLDSLNPVSEDLSTRITQGHESVPHSVPYQAYITIREQYSLIGRVCGGSLISRKFVLTAAHCLRNGVNASVILGAHSIYYQEPTQLRIVSEKLIIHEGFSLTGIRYDIGLVELPEKIQLTKYINVARLPTRKEAQLTYEGANAKVSGWGRLQGGGAITLVLQEVNSTVMSNAACRDYYGIYQDYQVCISGVGGVGICSGDAGGPLVVGDTQIGVASYGVGGCLDGYPSAFTRTNSFLDWLEKHTDLKF